MVNLTRTLVTDIPDLAVAVDESVAGLGRMVPVRVFHPEPDSALPVLIYLHGGGHMAGSVAVYDPICRKIALVTRRIVVAVDYRLAPEHPYPAGIDDARTVVAGYGGLLRRMGISHGAGLALAGDSAGGAMSATLAHGLQDRDTPAIDVLILIYPGLDYTLSQASVDELATGYLLEKEKISWYFDHYFGRGDDRKAASPLFMPVRPGFPRTLIVTAGFCPLCDEGFQYAAKLRRNGVAVEHLHLDDMIHAFLNLESLVPESCRRVYAAMAQFLGGQPVS
jgi:acetyl esterase/lipase